MADKILNNVAMIDGSYNNIAFLNTASTEVAVRLANILFKLTADQSIWFGGELTFTNTIDNSSTENEGSITNLVFKDQFDTTMFVYVNDSVTVTINDGTTTTPVADTDFTVTNVAGLLTITFNATVTIPVGSIMAISFRGTKA
ncbi:MAG: hypothetical protein LBL96_08690 [Clostridiales bacterium]|jgi:hypothetical protein|nr:hypothetical protein [Clostridiales bacterium]